MSCSIARSDLNILIREADAAARRALRRLRLPYADLDDLRQDLLVDLIARLPAFEPERGSLGAFAAIVLRNREARIVARVKRERRRRDMEPVSLDETLPGGNTRGDLIAEDEGLAALLGQPVDASGDIERRLDVARALGALAPRDGALCAALASTTPDRLAARGHGSRAGLYRRVKEMRLALTALGVRAA